MVTAQALPSLVPPGSANSSVKAESPERSWFVFISTNTLFYCCIISILLKQVLNWKVFSENFKSQNFEIFCQKIREIGRRSAHCSKSSFFCQKNQLWFPEKIVDFFWVKNSCKCCGFGLFSCWQLWFHEKNCQKNLGGKTRLGYEFRHLLSRFTFFGTFMAKQNW